MYLQLWNNCQKVAAHWDKERPEWWKDIDVDLLDMSNSKFCLLGQGRASVTKDLKSFIKAQDVLAVHHPTDKEFCKKLNQYWTTLIKQRQKNA